MLAAKDQKVLYFDAAREASYAAAIEPWISAAPAASNRSRF
jgi:hypothetical protein